MFTRIFRLIAVLVAVLLTLYFYATKVSVALSVLCEVPVGTSYKTERAVS
jgi:hypothetical protein